MAPPTSAFEPSRLHERGYYESFFSPQLVTRTTMLLPPSSLPAVQGSPNEDRKKRIDMKPVFGTLRELLESTPSSMSRAEQEELFKAAQFLSRAFDRLAKNKFSSEEVLEILRAVKAGTTPNLTLPPLSTEEAPAVAPIHRTTTALLVGSVVGSTLLGVFGIPSVYRNPTSPLSKATIGAFTVSTAFPLLALTAGENKTQEIIQTVGNVAFKVTQDIRNAAAEIKRRAIALKNHVVQYKSLYGALAIGAICYVSYPATMSYFSKQTITPVAKPPTLEAAPAAAEPVAVATPETLNATVLIAPVATSNTIMDPVVTQTTFHAAEEAPVTQALVVARVAITQAAAALFKAFETRISGAIADLVTDKLPFVQKL